MSYRMAVVHDWLTAFAGAERVVEELLVEFPEAEKVFTLVNSPENFVGTEISTKDIASSPLNLLPGVKRYYRKLLPLMPIAVESFDLRDFDVVICSSHAIAKGAVTSVEQLHVSYVHTPIRYAWDLWSEYLEEAGLDSGVKRVLATALLHYVRMWDVSSATRTDLFLANSQYVARRISKLYGREAAVVYPPVSVERFDPGRERDDFYLTVSRLVPYKKVPLVAKACAESNRRLIVVGDGPQRNEVRLVAAQSRGLVEVREAVDDESVAELMSTCRGFIFAAREDFGISPVEAQAAGAPVIAYGAGGALETVVAGKTGVFFGEQTPASVCEALDTFEARQTDFVPETSARNAAKFSAERFRREMREIVDTAWLRHRKR